VETITRDIKYYLKKSTPFILAIFISAIIVAASEVAMALSMKYALEILIAEKFSDIYILLIFFLIIIFLPFIGYYLLVRV
jgi:hypothetical protein